MLEWEFINKWMSYRKINGVAYVLIQKRAYNQWAVQYYASLSTKIVEREEIHDLDKAKEVGDLWLGLNL